MLLCLISWIIITNIGCTSKTSSLSQYQGSNVDDDGEWKYLNDLMHIGRQRRESYISCSQSPIQNNMTLKGGIQAGYFRKLAEHVAMQLCVELCCEDKGCDVAFMTGKSCYGVQCFNEELCLAFPAKRKVSDPVLISHVTFKGEKVVPKEQVKGKLQCVSTRVKVGATLRGGLKAGNFTDVGIVEDPKVCVNLCCVSETCNVALMVNERCFLVSCFSTKLCQMTRSLTPLYMSSLAYIQRKPIIGKKDKGNTSLLYDDSDSQLVCKNSKIFYNSTLKGGYHAGNYTNFGIVPNISSCIRWCCGNRDCDAAFMLENNCFAVACKSPDDCLPVHAKSSSSSAALKPRISYITSRSEEVRIKEDVSSGGICHAGIVSYDVTLRGGSNAGKFTPHGVVNNMKTCIFKCCQSEGCNVAMMLKDSCFSVICDSDEKCEKKPTQISSHFNPRIAYVFRDKIIKSKKTVSKETAAESHHHETLKHKKKMMLIEQLHALTNPNEKPASYSIENNVQAPPKSEPLPSYSPISQTRKFSNAFTTPVGKMTVKKNLKFSNHTPYVNYANKITYKNNLTAIKFIPTSYITYNKSERVFAQKVRPLVPPLYDFLRGNFDIPGEKYSVIHGLPRRTFSALPPSKVTRLYLNNAYHPSFKGSLLNSSSSINDRPFKIFPVRGGLRFYHLPMNSGSLVKSRTNINSWNKKIVYDSKSIQNSTDRVIPLRLSNILPKHQINPHTYTTVGPDSMVDSTLPKLNPGNKTWHRLTDNSINTTLSVKNNVKNIDLRKKPHSFDWSNLPEKEQIDIFDPYDDDTAPLIADSNQTNELDMSAKVIHMVPPGSDIISNDSSPSVSHDFPEIKRNKIQQGPSSSTTNDANSTAASVMNSGQSDTSTTVNNSLNSSGNATGYAMPIYFHSENNDSDKVDTSETEEQYKTNIKIGNSDPTCFRSKVFYNVTLRGGYDSGKFRDRGKMNVIECATLCCHLTKCDLVMMLLNRCFSVDCKNTNLCEAVPAKSPIFSPTICYVSHL